MRVRVKTAVKTQIIEEPVIAKGVDVQTVARNVRADARREPWYDGDVMVVPVYEEVMVKQLFLKQELRIAPTTRSYMESISVELSSDTAVFERQDNDGTWREVDISDLNLPSKQQIF